MASVTIPNEHQYEVEEPLSSSQSRVKALEDIKGLLQDVHMTVMQRKNVTNPSWQPVTTGYTSLKSRYEQVGDATELSEIESIVKDAQSLRTTAKKISLNELLQ
ncbi:hypothetical protein BDQ17DRAFT_1427195 [Cyathus striatus]|nr:hypothetical protein BDQ17DRAFT_1427195 [Cyathus striatus]